MNATVEDLLPLAPAQRGMIAEESRHPGQGGNVVHVSARVDGPLDPMAFASAWARVVARHVCLRSSFVWEHVREPVQVVRREVDLPVPVTDVDNEVGWTSAVRAEHRSALADPRRAPLLRVAVGRLAEGVHRLVWSYHHLIMDGWSSALVLREVLAEHDSVAGGGASLLDPPVPYVRVVDWLGEPTDTGFWADHLAGMQRPGTPPPPPVGRPQAIHRRLDPRLDDRLTGFRRTHRLTLATLVYAAWATLLARHTGATEVLLGSVSSGRAPEVAGIERVVGPLLQTVPVRVPVGARPLAPDDLAALQRRLHAAAEHGARLPLSAIAAAAKLSSDDLAFDSQVTVENYPDGLWRSGAVGSLRLSEVDFVESPGSLLCLEAVPLNDATVVRLVYDDARIDTDSAASLLGELPDVLRQLAGGSATPRRASTRPPVGTAAETIVDRWRRMVATYGEQVAIVDGDRRLTYAQADAAARRVAAAVAATLRAAGATGAGPEAFVAVLLSRTADLPVALLGVLLTGAAYVPIDAETPAARVAAVLTQCRAAAVVVDADLAAHVAGVDVPTVRIGRDEPSPPATGPAAATPHPDQPAYVIYTSGSTGAQKGVVVTHRNVVRLLDAARVHMPVHPGDVWSAAHSVAFDFSVWEVFGALLSGGRVVVLPSRTVRDPAALLAALREHEVSVYSTTPTAFSALVAGTADASLDGLHLRWVVFGGEALPFELLRTWQRRLGPGTRWLNMYGITETTVHVTVREVGPVAAELARYSCLGEPLADLRVDLLDRDGEPVGDQEVGELHVAGPGLARGYLDDPRATADRFRPDPAACRPGERRYRTGDLAVRLPNGEFAYRGRADRQLKVRGHRVEPGEIEVALRSHPGVAEAIVAPLADGRMGAWITPAEPARACRELLLEVDRHPDATLVELPGGVAVLHRNVAEALFTGEEVFGGGYLGGGLALAPGDTVLDVGANVGVFAVWAHLRYPGVRLFCMEPVPPVHELLVANLAAHGVDGRAVAAAAGAVAGERSLHYYPHASVLSGAGTGDERANVRAYLAHSGGLDDDIDDLLDDVLDARLTPEPVTAPVERLSMTIRRLGLARVDLLKVDVEGAEVDVLAGIDDEDWPLVVRLAVEVHGRERAERLRAELTVRGYHVTVERQASLAGTDLHMLHARVPWVDVAAPAVRPHSWHSPAALVADVRRHLEHYLPEHLRPHTLEVLARLPVTSNGKLDLAALRRSPSAGPAGLSRGGRPRPGVEALLARVWSDVLGTAELGRETGFFAAGGDSILCITMIAKLRRLGWTLTPREVFELRTLAALAAVARPVEASPLPPARRTGPVPLTAVQRWFFTLPVPARSHWNQAVLVRLTTPVEAAAVRAALQATAERHDAFRLRFRRDGQQWRQEIVADTGQVGWFVLRDADDVDAVHRSLDIERGPLLAGALVDDGSGRLLLVAHHLVVDAKSWPVLFRELAQRLAAARTGRAPELPEPSPGFQQWADASAEHVADYPAPDPSLGVEADARRTVVELTVDETARLASPIYRDAAVGPGELAFAALTYALARCHREDRVPVLLERHGRDTTMGDIAGTVGWFTEFEQVVVHVPAADDALHLVQTTLRASRRRSATRADPSATVFNYVGRLDAAPSGQLTVLDVAPGTLHDPAGAQAHRLAVEVVVVGDRLRSTFTSADSVDPDEVAAVTATYLQALRMLGLVGRYPPPGPSVLDFPVADVTSDELDAVRAAVPDLVDVYPLTPMQEGLLFHTIYDAAAEPYVNQFFWTIDGPLDHAALASAWEATCARHAVLRTGVWTAAHRAHQVVHAQGHPMTVADDGTGWPDLLAAERAAVRGDGSAPLVRLAVLRVDDDSHRVVWTHHHLLFDGWCTGPVLGDLFTAYDAVRHGQPPAAGFGAAPRPFSDYVRWLDDEDIDVSAAFWRAQLAGAVSTYLPPEPRAVVESADGEGIVRHVFAADAAEHVARAQRGGTTLNTIALAGWAIALLPECGDDLVVGNTVSGRSVDLDPPPTGGGAEDIVGLLINTVPARVRVAPATGLRAWLATVQADATAAREHEHVTMTAIRRWVDIDPAGPLFDTAVVVENLPDASLLRQAPPGLAVRDVGSRVRNHYTLTLRVIPQAPLAVEALFDPSRTTHARATDLLTRAARAMIAVAELAGTPGATVSQALAAADATPDADRLVATRRQM